MVVFTGYLLIRPDGGLGNNPAPANQQSPPKKGVVKTLTGEQFRQIYDATAYPNSAHISEKSPITGYAEADERIRDIAEGRGYKIRSAPVADNFVEVEDGMLLQPRAAASWRSLKNAAKQGGIELGMFEAYRSAASQRAIFLARLGKVSLPDLARGRLDGAVDSLLETTAPPGYSRHHTGYTIDLSCPSDPGVLFENSKCFSWLSANNYAQAKTHGWIPSYPEGGGKQGPDPEAWEYVWVGTDVLTE